MESTGIAVFKTVELCSVAVHFVRIKKLAIAHGFEELLQRCRETAKPSPSYDELSWGWGLDLSEKSVCYQGVLGAHPLDHPVLGWSVADTDKCLEDSSYNARRAHIDERSTLHQHARMGILLTGFLAGTGATLYEQSFFRPSETRGLLDAPPADWMRLPLHQLIPLVLFTTATTAIYHTNKCHRCQDQFLLAGISLGALAGMGIYRDVMDTMVKVMPWTILMALLLSLLVHELWIRKAG